jgi:hypothetical protein
MGHSDESRSTGGRSQPERDTSLRQPFSPINARARRRDGNAAWWTFRNWLECKIGKPLLKFGPFEFVWTLYEGPVYYEPTDIPATPEKVEKMISTQDEERLKELYEHSKGLIKREQDQSIRIEGRANVLLGTGGLTTTLIVGLSGLLARGDADKVLPPGSISRGVFLVLYIVGLLALVMSLLRAVHTVRVGSMQPFSATRPFEVQNFADSRKLHLLIREAFLTFVDARESNRVRAGLLAAAQWWFGTALVTLLIMATVPLLEGSLQSFWELLAGIVGSLRTLVDQLVTCGRTAR